MMTALNNGSIRRYSSYVVHAATALLVIAFVASLVSPLVPEQTQWATLDEEMHASWNPSTSTIPFSLQITRHQDCHRVVTGAFLRPIGHEGDLELGLIELKSGINVKLEKAPLGEKTTRFDEAVPQAYVTPGQYYLSLIAYCEPPPAPPSTLPSGLGPPSVPPTPILLASNQIQVLVIVHTIEGSDTVGGIRAQLRRQASNKIE